MAPEVVDKGFLLTSLRHFIDGLELDFARYAAEFDQSKQWDEEGFNNPADWMRFNCHMNSHAAWNALGVGEHEAKLSQSIAALRAGEIGFAHLGVLLPHLLQLSPADGLRLQRQPGPAQPGVGDYRRRALEAGDIERDRSGSEGSRWLLPIAGLRTLYLD